MLVNGRWCSKVRHTAARLAASSTDRRADAAPRPSRRHSRLGTSRDGVLIPLAFATTAAWWASPWRSRTGCGISRLRSCWCCRRRYQWWSPGRVDRSLPVRCRATSAGLAAGGVVRRCRCDAAEVAARRRKPKANRALFMPTLRGSGLVDGGSTFAGVGEEITARRRRCSSCISQAVSSPAVLSVHRSASALHGGLEVSRDHRRLRTCFQAWCGSADRCRSRYRACFTTSRRVTYGKLGRELGYTPAS